ncbi:MAG: site-2 protease family protein [Candidatus Limnocylindrales bacterium]
MDAIINLVLLLALLTVLVLLHELGHFVAARRAGVTVHEFGIGFPPRAAVLFRRGDTVYTLNWLPIGGFVRMEGEERSPADGTPDEEPQLQPERADHVESLDPNAFTNQPLRTRLWILFAGVAVNFVLAWLIFTLVALLAQPIWKVRVAEVQPDSPAAAAGLVGGEYIETVTLSGSDEAGRPVEVEVDRFDASGDAIIAVDGMTFPVFDDMAQVGTEQAGRPGLLLHISERPSETLVLTVERAGGSLEEVEVTTRTAEEIEAQLGALGFQVQGYEFDYQQNGIAESMVIGVERTVETSTLILRALGNIVAGLFSGSAEGLEDVAGPVGMVGVIGDVRSELPPVFLLWFVGLISANLAVLNALPIPPLDGSRAVMAVAQRLSGDRISASTERLIYFTGWVALMVFIVIVTISDIQGLLD